MLKRVLVAIDGSDHSWRALEYACALVKLSGGDLVIITVAPKNKPVPVLFADGDCMTAQIGDEVLDAARSVMRKQNINCSYLLERGGNIAEHILQAEKTEDCDAIVLGSRGFGMLEGLFKNSISQVVVESADVPVIIVK
ncbi:MAG: universal stress protein [Phascolarctobacterium sp.]|nr:universal stress protein [Phascolarctobacterium sp.]